MPRHASTHAAGVVITPEPTDYYLPLATNDGLPVTQFNMTEIEELGLLKMDFLGLRTLTVIRDAELAIQKKEPDFSIAKLDYDDPETPFNASWLLPSNCGRFCLERTSAVGASFLFVAKYHAAAHSVASAGRYT